MSDRPAATAQAVLQIADAVGALMEGWGFKRNMGRLWTLLYLELRPLSAPEICERLALSSGAVSMLLAELTQWGAVRKTWIVGERREHYEAETSIWKMVSRVFRERELRWIEQAAQSFTSASDIIRADANLDTSEQQRQLMERVAGLVQLAHIGAHLLKSMLEGDSIDTLPLKSIGELAKVVNATQAAPTDPKKPL